MSIQESLVTSRASIASIVVLLLTVLLAPCARAWGNGGYSSDVSNPDYGTHDWIADMALTLQVRDVTYLSVTYHDQFLIGTEGPDNPAYIGDSTNHHVYYYSSGTIQDDKCAVRASQMYQVALGYMLAVDWEDAAYSIGALTHYVADVGVFGHTMGAYTDWGAETHHSDYENAIESMVGSLELPTGTSLGDLDAYTATLYLAEDITFGSGAIMSNVWMDDNYDWADDPFVASAMASLYGAVSAVAAVINHLMIEAGSSTPTPPPPNPSPQVPQAPVSLTAVVEDSHVMLTWSPPPSDGGSSITGYIIYRGTSPDNPSVLTSVPGDTLSWIDESAQKGKTYYYWIVAENSVGLSGMSQPASVTIPRDSNSMALPIGLSAIAVALASGGVFLWQRKARGKPPS